MIEGDSPLDQISVSNTVGPLFTRSSFLFYQVYRADRDRWL
jgi:hypothetical protein